jgi:cardiolipin synthase
MPMTQRDPELEASRSSHGATAQLDAPALFDPRCQGPAGMAPGVNIAPGSDDDGWVVPPPVSLADGTHLQLYKDGEALRAAREAILAAQKRICLEVYIFADDNTGHAFADALCEKARQGIGVYVIYDSFGSRGWLGPEPDMFRQMRAAGVHLQQFHPMRPWECQYSWRFVNRDHRKLLLVDDDIAGIGGLNVGAEYGGSWVVTGPAGDGKCEQWRDNAVGIRGPGTAAFRQAFAHTWQYITHGGRIARAFYQHELFDGELGLLASVPTLDSPLRPTLFRLMRSAKKCLLMTMAYFAPEDALVDELCRAARRGVRVRLMLPGRSDVPTVRIAARSFYDLLMNCGIEVYERQGVILHAKTMVIDDHTTMIGSTNLDYRSIEYNCELSAVIRNADFGRQMHDLFDNDVRYARRIDPAAWRRRPNWDRLVQWVVSRGRRLL